MFIPKELSVYVLRRKTVIYLLSVSFLQGWSIIRFNNAVFLFNFETIISFKNSCEFNSEQSLWQNASFGMYKNYIHFLKFKGMGFKTLVLRSMLNIKLSFSHKVFFKVVENIKLEYKHKQLLKLGSRNFLSLKNIVYSLKTLKKPNVYKKLGVYIKGVVSKLKLSSKKSKF